MSKLNNLTPMNKIISETYAKTHKITTYESPCNYCGAKPGPDRCGCEVCCVCKGKKYFAHTSKQNLYLCIGGPLDGKHLAQTDAADYILFNRSSYYNSVPVPKCILLYKGLLG